MELGKYGIRSGLAASVAVVAAVTAAPVRAQPRAFNVRSLPAAQGIPEFAKQADVQILVSEAAVRGRRTAAVRGILSTEEALSRLLDKSGLRITSSDGRTYTLALANVTAQASPKALPSARRPRGATAETAALEPQVPTQDVVVTGSRVITNGNNSPTPLTVVLTEQIQQVTPSNIPDGLNKLPIFAGSSNQSTFGAAERNYTGNYLNLRSVGAARTLILFDGHRFPPTTTDNLIDTNAIPQMLIQRVDIVTGGASAVYGSDAITGVVNFVVDKKFNGLKLNLQGGISGRNDNESVRMGAAWGRSLFGDRGHLEASFEYYNSHGIGDKLGRDYGRAVYSTQGAGTAANPFRLVRDTRLTNFSRFGLIKNGIFADQVFGGPGNSLRPFVHGVPTGTNGVESGGDGTFYHSSLQASLRSYQAFARFDYELGDRVNFYTQGTATDSYNAFSKEENVISNVMMSSQNPFLPAQYRAMLAAANQSSFTFARQMTEVPRLTPTAWIRNYYIVAGLNGSIGKNIRWDIGYSHSEARQKVATIHNMNLGRLYASLDAVSGPNGEIVCNVTLTNPGLYPGCVPINPFGEATISQSAQDYILQDTKFRLHNKMDDFTASIAGVPFDTWAGPVKAAISGEYRHLYMDLISDAQPLQRTSCTGLRFNCTASTPLFASNVVGDMRSRNQHVTEAALEVEMPLLADRPFARSLNLNAAARYTHYDTSGDVMTWKIGIDWHVTSELTLRGTRSRDIRAPNLNDLYAPINVNPSGFNDLHTGITSTVLIESSGNPDLKPEVAQTLTLGAVYRPDWLPGFSIAIDYFKLAMDNAIGTVSASNSSVQRECETSNGTSPFCALFDRPLPFNDRSAANFPTRAYARQLNVATLDTHGIDIELNYAAALAGGNFSLRGLLSYQPKNVTVNFRGSTPLDRAGASDGRGQPRYRTTSFIHYDRKGVAIDIQQRWHSATRQSSDPTLVFDAADVSAMAYTDLTLSYDLRVANGFSVRPFLTIQNLWDKQPSPYVATGAPSSVPGFFVPVTNGDDPIGRYFTAGVRMRF
jgi:outer membrane receptor protein involved in Fe transport